MCSGYLSFVSTVSSGTVKVYLRLVQDLFRVYSKLVCRLFVDGFKMYLELV